MNILLTGCAGFIGSHLCEELLQKGHSIIGIDDLNDYYPSERKQANLKLLSDENFKFHEIDIRDEEMLKHLFSDHSFDAVIHIAARAGVRPSLKDPELYHEVNVKATESLLKLSKENKLKKFIFGSSSSVYGESKQIPFTESQDNLIQISPYAKTKFEAEQLCKKYADDMKIIALRFFTVYGPRGRPDMAPYIFLSKAINDEPIDKYGDGTSSRDYTYVADIVAGIIAALEYAENMQSDFEIVNLGNSRPITLNDFIATIEKVTGKKLEINELPMQEGDVPITFADISKAKELLGWEPKISLEQGLKNTYDWLCEE